MRLSQPWIQWGLAAVAVVLSSTVGAQGRLSTSLAASTMESEYGLSSDVLTQSIADRTSSAETGQAVPAEGSINIAPVSRYSPIESDLYGQWLFSGNFARESFSGFNPDYVLGVGDVIDLRFWGGLDFQAQLEIDSQGRVFIPRLGPIRISGVRNGDLNKVLRSKLQTIFREEVGVYAALSVTQPVKVFVGGGVIRPGLYDATASDSLLHFLDRAGGVEPEAGSYRDIRVLRNGKVMRRVDLYDFLTEGALPLIQLRDGDTVFVGPRGPVALVGGMVAWPRRFEFSENANLQWVLNIAQSRAEATHARITRQAGERRETLVFSLANDLTQVEVQPGDVIDVYADRPYSTVLVRIDGEHEGESQLVLPYGATLADALAQVSPTPISDTNNARLFRQSLVVRQKEVISQLLNKLEESVLTARSNTAKEAALRSQEAQLILQFVERARDVEPRGQVILQDLSARSSIVLEEGDRVDIPRANNLVGVHGEIYLPAAFSWRRSSQVHDYIRLAGGFTQSGARDRVLLMKPNGKVEFAKTGGWLGGTEVQPGDEILVLPRVDTKGFQLTKDVVEVIYQIAIAAGVLVRL